LTFSFATRPFTRSFTYLITTLITTGLSLTFAASAHAESQINRDGKWYGYWGWNKADYQDSTIHFSGDNHDFTLYDVQATDRQTPVTLENIFGTYLNPLEITIPQYNVRFGYFITNDISISLGWDHMKYVVKNGQTVEMSGYIDADLSVAHQKDDSTGRIDKVLTHDFLTYEHTDGFNTLTVEGEYYYSVLERNWFQSNSLFDLSVLAGGGAGIVYPRSDVRLASNKDRDEWHWAGVTASAKIGFEITGWDNFFYRMSLKQGYANMYDVLTTYDGGKADQGIHFTQYIGAFGYRF
jgi:hypothetical protein